jgi:ribonuclease J
MKEQINFAKEMNVPYPVEVENGDIVKIYPGNKPYVFDKAPSGRLCVDGNISIEEDSSFIKERKNLANNGFIDVTLVINNKGNLHDKPIVYLAGIPVIEKDDFLYGLDEEIKKITRTFSLKNIDQQKNLIDVLKKTCRKYSKEKTGKKPITNINLVRI